MSDTAWELIDHDNCMLPKSFNEGDVITLTVKPRHACTIHSFGALISDDRPKTPPKNPLTVAGLLRTIRGR